MGECRVLVGGVENLSCILLGWKYRGGVGEVVGIGS